MVALISFGVVILQKHIESEKEYVTKPNRVIPEFQLMQIKCPQGDLKVFNLSRATCSMRDPSHQVWLISPDKNSDLWPMTTSIFHTFAGLIILDVRERMTGKEARRNAKEERTRGTLVAVSVC